MTVGAVDFALFTDHKLRSELSSGHSLDYLVVTRLLISELVTREGNYFEALVSEFLMDLN